MLHKLVLTESTTFAEAVGLLDLNGNGFLPVVSTHGKLVGILTDGDVRRAILKDIRDVRRIINSSPAVALNTEERHTVIRRLHQLKRRHMPVVDSQGNFVDVIVLNDFNAKSIPNRVVIMAGGLGTRLGELTKETPKPMLRVKGKPILERIIESFRGFGFHDFTFCLNYKSEIIENHFGDGSDFSVSINYTIEEKRLGTAGALSLIDRSLLREPFLVTNGDILTALNYEDFIDTHAKTNSVATMCVKQHSMQLPYANIISDEDGNLISLEEKPHIPFYINAGIYALNPEALEYIPYNEYFDMPSLYGDLINKGKKVKTYKMDDYWVDIGMPNDFRQANDNTV